MEEKRTAGFTVRPASQGDLEAVADLIIASDIADRGESDVSAADLRVDWQHPDFDLERDAWVVVTKSGSVIGYAELWNRANHALLNGDGYVHPDYMGLGIGTRLLELTEGRARQHLPDAPAGSQVVIRSGVSGKDIPGQQLHEQQGYRPARYFWRMEITLDAPPPEAQWPDGLRVRAFEAGEDPRPVFDALEEAFRDHWGYSPWNFTAWTQRMMDEESFNPALWFLAMDGEQIAGGALCRFRQDIGWVTQLGVRRPWRRMGLGLALLRHSFAEFFRLGATRIGLGVDAQNPTGATHLYEKAGMHLAHSYIVYQKELRPGSPI